MQSPDSSFSKGASLATVFPSVSESAQVDITARNRQIFRRYAKTFANLSDPAFGEHAAKFAVWLSSPRGYYETARPEVCFHFTASKRALTLPQDSQTPNGISTASALA